jgi:hypothetical protein
MTRFLTTSLLALSFGLAATSSIAVAQPAPDACRQGEHCQKPARAMEPQDANRNAPRAAHTDKGAADRDHQDQQQPQAAEHRNMHDRAQAGHDRQPAPCQQNRADCKPVRPN